MLLQSLFAAFKADGLTTPPRPASKTPAPHGEVTEDLRLRLLLSALCDADYLDTEQHFLSAAGKFRPTSTHDAIPDLLAKLDAPLARAGRGLNQATVPV